MKHPRRLAALGAADEAYSGAKGRRAQSRIQPSDRSDLTPSSAKKTAWTPGALPKPRMPSLRSIAMLLPLSAITLAGCYTISITLPQAPYAPRNKYRAAQGSVQMGDIFYVPAEIGLGEGVARHKPPEEAVIPVSPACRAALEEATSVSRFSPYVLATSDGARFSVSKIDRAFKSEPGVNHTAVPSKDLRHTFGSRCAAETPAGMARESRHRGSPFTLVRGHPGNRDGERLESQIQLHLALLKYRL